MNPYLKKQIRTVLLIELAIGAVFFLITYAFWESFCGSSWKACLHQKQPYDLVVFFILAIIRPMLFSPIMILAMIGGYQFGPYVGTILIALGSGIASLVMYFPGVYLGKRLVRSWLQSNLPSTWRLIRNHDFKLVFLARWIPVLPFDFCSLLFGVANFRAWRVFAFSTIGILPEAWIFTNLGATPESFGSGSFLFDLTGSLLLAMLPLLLFEYRYRKKGSSLWNLAQQTYHELVVEANMNNLIQKRESYDPTKRPVILIYGFFSTRRSMVIFERILTSKGHQVMTFNLGGVLGVFFTRGVRETAEYIDTKIKRQLNRYGFEKVDIVSHSKGGLVALWWLLKMGGAKHCDRLITMGTPYKGSWITYLALLTPLGFFLRDVWQMRPNSEFLRELHMAEIPQNLKIYCCYSNKDKVAPANDGIFSPMVPSRQVVPVPMHHIAHFEYLYKRDAIETVAKLLEHPEDAAPEADTPYDEIIEILPIGIA